jgi:predicted enzyme related to lactoylglutathione lyase
MMTKLRTGDAFMPADEYGRSMPSFSVNLLVRNVENSVRFYRDVVGVDVRYADSDFAALQLQGWDFMLHADHTYDHHPLFARLSPSGQRGDGAELRFLGVDPDVIEGRARRVGVTILQPAMDFPHGWRDVMLVDPDGYIWALGKALPRKSTTLTGIKASGVT